MGWGPHILRVAFVREAVVRFARDGWIGRLAGEVGLEDTLRDVYDDPDGVLLRLFRACDAASVYTASPLAWTCSPRPASHRRSSPSI